MLKKQETVLNEAQIINKFKDNMMSKTKHGKHTKQAKDVKSKNVHEHDVGKEKQQISLKLNSNLANLIQSKIHNIAVHNDFHHDHDDAHDHGHGDAHGHAHADAHGHGHGDAHGHNNQNNDHGHK